MMSLDSISKHVYFRRTCPFGTIMAYVIVSVLPIGVAAQVVLIPPCLLRDCIIWSCRVQTNPRSATRSPFHVTTPPPRLFLSFLRCTSGFEAETRPAPVETWCRSS